MFYNWKHKWYIIGKGKSKEVEDMILFWNRREVFTGASPEAFYKMRQKLEDNNIKYDYRMASHTNPSIWGSEGAIMGTFGQDLKYATTYYLYVHKKNYEYACAVLRSN